MWRNMTGDFNIRLYLALFFAPASCVIGYMVINKHLALSGIILAICLCISGSLLYYVLAANVAAQRNNLNDLDDTPLIEIFSNLQQHSASLHESCITMDILQRKIEKNQKRRAKQQSSYMIETDLVSMGLVDHLLTVLENCTSPDEKTVLPSLQLINAVLSESKARDQLFDTMTNLKSTIDRYSAFLKHWFAASSSDGLRLEKLRLKVAVVVSVAITLMAINCPAAQSRIGDKGGIFFVHSVLLSKEFLGKPQVVVIAVGCLLTLTTDHPPNKGELFRNGGINIINDILHRYVDHDGVCAYTLKLLHNLICDDIKAKHSLGRAREVCFQLQMTDLILKIRQKHSGNDQIARISGEVLKLMASNFS